MKAAIRDQWGFPCVMAMGWSRFLGAYNGIASCKLEYLVGLGEAANKDKYKDVIGANILSTHPECHFWGFERKRV